MSSSAIRQEIFKEYRESFVNANLSVALLREIITVSYNAGEEHIKEMVVNHLNNHSRNKGYE